MSLATLVSPSDYLATTYRPDRELLHGGLVERNLGEFDNGNLQAALVEWLRSRRHDWNIWVLPEQRVQVSSNHFRIPDVCVISREHAIEQVITRPPLVCIEVLSKDDTLSSMQDRVDDYLAFGVRNIWVIDPVRCRAYTCEQGDFRDPQDGTLQVAYSPIRIVLADLFADLD